MKIPHNPDYYPILLLEAGMYLGHYFLRDNSKKVKRSGLK
ncbi:hypothetical protein AQPE_3936 [Aquipluma nitroreducens]|uniref:Uncharacterized protein n=1 Tax=Aquipluma nitroreducens TaxID=2010828 RepID=A0A5K7SDU8_9BACT|nr:hypothetical protein AQPE_3936 [Aquipluma nitroreducens]